MLIVQCIFVVLLSLCEQSESRDLIVTTKYGDIRGFPIQTTKGHKAVVYLGIPFAAPPIGSNRFEKPKEPSSWEGIKPALEFPPQCIPHDRSAAGDRYSEDCLYLNIITPFDSENPEEAQNDTMNKYAVMVWIHGGAYCVGSSSVYGYTGIVDNFISRQTIVVTIQYRLGPYGFLTDGTTDFPGNNGLWDQYFAIKFVKENIAAFGGDPNRITLFGSSAGGGSVSAHTLSPYSRDLFTGSIEISGSTLAPWASGDEVIAVSKNLTAELRCPSTVTEAMKSCLRTKTPDQIFDAVAKIGLSRYGFNIAKFAPRIDGHFFPKDFETLVKEAPKKPSIIGLVEKEAAFFTVEGNLQSINQFYINSADYETFGKEDVVTFIKTVAAPETIFGQQTSEVQNKLIYHYLEKDDVKVKDYKYYLAKYTQIISDVMFNIPCIRMKQLRVENDWPVWFYFNTHYNPSAYTRDIPIKGAVHLDEYPYLFDITPYKHFQLNDEDRKVQKAMLETFTNFAKVGTPSTAEYRWDAVTMDSPLKHFLFSPNPAMDESYFSDTVNFWEEMQQSGYDIVNRRCHRCTFEKDEL